MPTMLISPLLSDGPQDFICERALDLFVKPADGLTEEQPLLVNEQEKSSLDWSPDGRVILYGVQDVKTRADLWALPVTDDGKPLPIAQTSFDELHGRFSPDGRWLAYVSNETGRYEVYVRPSLFRLDSTRGR
jgi:eukaryotic-like serine/threonine-protein kinase